MLARLLVMACLGATDAALAQNYPAKPMRMIVPYPADAPTLLHATSRTVGSAESYSGGYGRVRRSRCAPRVLVGAILLARFVPACAVVFTPPDFFAAS